MQQHIAHKRAFIILSASVAVALIFAATVIGHDTHGGSSPPYDGPGWDSNSEGPPPISFPASGVELLSWMPVHAFGDFNNANDCWGYVSPDGIEYAILGLSGGTAFIDVSSPALPDLVAVVPGPTSLWRDVKTHQHYCYAVSEGGGGIQVIDLSAIDDGVVTDLGFFTDAGSVATDKTHTVHINEESGYLYRAGGGSGVIGLRIYSLADAANPSFVGEWHDRYVHDVQVVNWTDGPFAGREIAFAYTNETSGGGSPGLDILDVTEKDNIINIGFASYSWPGYSHQGWLTEDRQYVLLNDELAEVIHGITTTTRVIDVSDLTNPFEAATFTNGNTAIGHNIFIRGNFSFHANYRSGLRIFDIGDPLNAFEVGYFDTWPEDDNPAFSSLWSPYPYLPSGIVIGSDIEKGLFIWSVDELIPPKIPGDLNGDGVVNVLDLLLLLGEWGRCAECIPGDSDACPADLDGNCVVDVFDLLILVGNWG